MSAAGQRERVPEREKKGLDDSVKPGPRRFLELLEPIRDELYRYARRAAWNPDDAPDILQEAVMIAWRSFESFEAGTNFRAWIFQILVNTTFNFNKRYRRRQEVPLADAELELPDFLERENAWATMLNRPDGLAELVDGRILSSLECLNENERQCFLLRLLESFSYKDIAAMLDIPVGTVMSHVHRARMKLREDLATFAVERGFVREPVS